jgi:hypothetical protein
MQGLYEIKLHKNYEVRKYCKIIDCKINVFDDRYNIVNSKIASQKTEMNFLNNKYFILIRIWHRMYRQKKIFVHSFCVLLSAFQHQCRKHEQYW